MNPWRERAEKAEIALAALKKQVTQVVSEIGAERAQNEALISELQTRNEERESSQAELQAKLERAVEVLRRARDERAAQDQKIQRVISLTKAIRAERDELRDKLERAERRAKEAEAVASSLVASKAAPAPATSQPPPAAAASAIAVRDQRIKDLEHQVQVLRRDLDEANAALGFTPGSLSSSTGQLPELPPSPVGSPPAPAPAQAQAQAQAPAPAPAPAADPAAVGTSHWAPALRPTRQAAAPPASSPSDASAPQPDATPGEGHGRCRSELPPPKEAMGMSTGSRPGVTIGDVDAEITATLRQQGAGSRKTQGEQPESPQQQRYWWIKKQDRKAYRQSVRLNDLLRDVEKM